uniref:E3 ubiquitin-protein ligase RNF217 n=1 Tax=Acanthochromis polyacanthus TaxID=80966 RepID=A0A3Q1FVK3_9TELE
MGRTEPGMDDDGPVAAACDMPSFISSLEEGRARLSRNPPAETSSSDGKVEPDRVSGSESRISLDGGSGEPEERGGGERRDAEGNNNNNCNGGGRRAGRRYSAVEVLRRNFGEPKSPSLRFSFNGRMQKQESSEGRGDGDGTDGNGTECGECEKSDGEPGGAGTKNEPTSASSAGTGVDPATGSDRSRHPGEGDPSSDTLEECVGAKQHVYCTVYCIAADAELSHLRDEPDTETDLETGREGSPSPEPVLYTLEDLVDPFGDLSHRLYLEQAGAGTAVQSCRVCLEDKTIASLPCCRKAVCDGCLKLYVSSQVRVAKALISCPIPECSGSLDEALVVSHLVPEDVAKYHYFLELSQLDSSTKPCPQCSHFTSLKTHNQNQNQNQNQNRSEHKYKIQCSNCQFVWCFKCHAPWHNGLKCRDYRKGDKLLRTWASVIEHGQRNAQKCPECKIHIQRTEGCDHMTCTQCNTNFCYRCGERYRHLRFFGDHTSNLSVFGCKYRYLPDKPHLRRFIRGSVCASKVLIAPVVLLLVVVLGALALVIGLVVFPVYYVCKRRKKQQRTRGSGRWI